MIYDHVNGHPRLTMTPEEALFLIRDLSTNIGLAQRSVRGSPAFSMAAIGAGDFTEGKRKTDKPQSFATQVLFCVQSPAMALAKR